jgi:hypothetical protein
MDPVFASMLDTVRIATFLPRAPHAETRRFAQEPEHGSTDVATVDESAPSNDRAVAPWPMRLGKWLVLKGCNKGPIEGRLWPCNVFYRE